jgi:hypothetical protein
MFQLNVDKIETMTSKDKAVYQGFNNISTDRRSNNFTHTKGLTQRSHNERVLTAVSARFVVREYRFKSWQIRMHDCKISIFSGLKIYLFKLLLSVLTFERSEIYSCAAWLVRCFFPKFICWREIWLLKKLTNTRINKIKWIFYRTHYSIE